MDAHHKKSTLEQLNATLESTQASLEDARSQLQEVQERLSQVSKQREEGLQREADDQEELTQLRAEVEALNEEGVSMLLHQCAEVAILEALLRHYADGHAQTVGILSCPLSVHQWSRRLGSSFSLSVSVHVMCRASSCRQCAAPLWSSNKRLLRFRNRWRRCSLELTFAWHTSSDLSSELMRHCR